MMSNAMPHIAIVLAKRRTNVSFAVTGFGCGAINRVRT